MGPRVEFLWTSLGHNLNAGVESAGVRSRTELAGVRLQVRGRLSFLNF